MLDCKTLEKEPWNYRWLKGEEYYEILIHMDQFCQKYQFLTHEEHPESIYFKPKSGQIYFLRCKTLRMIGFPRLNDNQRKNFKWKKMNFQTPLPKSKPKVSYIVCSTNQINDVYRMHIVQTYDLQRKEQPQSLLCHILSLNEKIYHILQKEQNLSEINNEEDIGPENTASTTIESSQIVIQPNEIISNNTNNNIEDDIFLEFPIDVELNFIQQKIRVLYDEELQEQKGLLLKVDLNYFKKKYV